jgi:hypothetical protein
MTWNSYTATERAKKHRVFLSYHHKDESYRQLWDKLFASILISTSVGPGEMDDSNSAEYIKRLIQRDYITQSSVVVVLVGPKTYCRKHIDWEISAGLNKKVGGYSGLLGIRLPNHPDYGRNWRRENTPPRLADNVASGYAAACDWAEDVDSILRRIEKAFRDRIEKADLIENWRPQFSRDLCD